MARKKVTLAYIRNDAKRKASFRKRKKGLLKKAEELTTLCGIQLCVILYCPYDREPEVWPSRAGVMEVLARYQNLSEIEQSKKMVNQESFTRHRLKKVEDQLRRVRRETMRREMESFMYLCIAGMVSLQRFDLSNVGEMRWVVDQTLREISSRMDVLKINGQVGSTSGPAEAAAGVGGELGWVLGSLSNSYCYGNGGGARPG